MEENRVGLTIPLAAARMSHDDRPCPESAPPVKKEDPPTESYRFLPRITSLSAAAHRHPFPLFCKKEISLFPSLQRKFLIRYSIPLEDRSNDRFQLPISPVPLRKGMRSVEWKGDGSRFALKAETQYRGHASIKRANARDSCQDQYNSHGCNRLRKPRGWRAG